MADSAALAAPEGPLVVAWAAALGEAVAWDPHLVWTDVNAFSALAALGGTRGACPAPDEWVPVLLKLKSGLQGALAVPQGAALLPAYEAAQVAARWRHVAAAVRVAELGAVARQVESLQVALPRLVDGAARPGEPLHAGAGGGPGAPSLRLPLCCAARPALAAPLGMATPGGPATRPAPGTRGEHATLPAHATPAERATLPAHATLPAPATLPTPATPPEPPTLPASAPAPAPAGASAPPPRRLVVGVIDDGFAFAYRRFLRDDGTTRVVSLWQQDVPAPQGAPAWHAPPGWYGRELDRAAIDGLLAAHRSGESVDEAALYRSAGYLHPTARAYHGTHVLDLAAGWPQPLAREASGRPVPIALTPRDAAAAADLVLVQLPTRTSLDTSGASLPGHVLDALHYIVDRADGADVVVNLSYGTHAGPHDGSSFLESAIAEVLGAVNGSGTGRRLDIVVPAGNAHESRCHASGELRAGKPVTLRWEILPDDVTDSFLEIWLPAESDVAVTLTTPDGRTRLTARPGELAVDRAPGGGCRCAVIRPRLSARGGPGAAMALVAVSPTRRRGSGPTAPHGVWTVELVVDDERSADGEPAPAAVQREVGATSGAGATGVAAEGRPGVPFDAWIERDDAVYGSHHGGRQSRFDRADAVSVGTLNSIAGLEADGYSVVGGMRASDGAIADYSGAGPNRDGRRPDGPDAVTWSDESRMLAGLPAAGSLGAARVRMNGTSVAAPLYARRVAARDVPAASARKAGPQHRPRGLAVEEPPERRLPKAPDDVRGGKRRLDPLTSVPAASSRA